MMSKWGRRIEREVKMGAIQVMAQSLRVELTPIDPRDADEIERGLTSLSGNSNAGLIVTTSRLARLHRALILSLVNRFRLPAVYPFRVYTSDGGLMSYGPSSIEPYRRAAGYVDRILRGEKPGDLPVQAPTKYDLIVNLNAARALGLSVPQSIVTRADEVIE